MPPRASNTDAKTEVSRILAAKTHYAVLEVEHSADDETIKRAKKMKSLLVHPDKAGNLAGAADAFGKVINVSTSISSWHSLPAITSRQEPVFSKG